MWPTVAARDYRSPNANDNQQDQLPNFVKMWPTATADPRTHTTRQVDHGNQLANEAEMWPTARAEHSESCGNHPGATDSLTGATREWATPRTITGGAESAQRKQELGRTESGGGDLQAQVSMWQTPATDSFRSRGGDRKNEMGLDQEARLWPTPVANDDQKTPEAHLAMKKRMGERDGVQAFHPAPTTTKPGATCWCGNPGCGLRSHKRKLNPWFVEALMGFPPDWTARHGCARLATPSYPPKRSMR